jgi:hypothetical protein
LQIIYETHAATCRQKLAADLFFFEYGFKRKKLGAHKTKIFSVLKSQFLSAFLMAVNDFYNFSLRNNSETSSCRSC